MISVEIPVLHGRYLNEVFESIRAQTFQDYEVVVVNSSQKGGVSNLIKEYWFNQLRKT